MGRWKGCFTEWGREEDWEIGVRGSRSYGSDGLVMKSKGIQDEVRVIWCGNYGSDGLVMKYKGIQRNTKESKQ